MQGLAVSNRLLAVSVQPILQVRGRL